VPAVAKEVGEGTTNVKVAEAISGLVAGTLYHYRLTATNGVSTGYGVDMTFTTTTVPLHWFACTKQTGGRYNSNKCSAEGASKEWESIRLKEAEKVSITAKGAPITFAATISGLKGSFSCETEVSATSLENPTGGGNGTGSAEIKYKGCKTVENWTNCVITPGAVVPSKLELVTFEGKPQAWLSAKEGTVFANFSFSGCNSSSLNGARNLYGTLRGSYSNANSKIEFSTESTATGLRFNHATEGPLATGVGSIGLEASGGGYLAAVNAPSVSTEAASSIKPTEATLNGTVNPEGANTRYQFEYGKTTSYGQSAPAVTKEVGEGTTNVKVAETPTGLVPGTLYHYRLTATNGVSTGYGADMTFTSATVPLHWFACTKQSGGKYTSNKCATEGSPKEWELLKLKEAEKVSVTAKGAPITFAATISGLKGSFSCETEVSAPSLENPTGGGAGGGSAEIKYKGCKTVENWTNCVITPGAVVPSKLELATFEGKSQARLSAKEGTVFANFSFSGCNSSSLNGTRNLYGTLRGSYSNANSKIEFSTESTATGLRFNNASEGPLATGVGSIGLEASGGASVKVE